MKLTLPTASVPSHLRWALCAIGIGIVPMVLYAALPDRGLGVFASAFMVAAAAALVGALLGFLFGVPRAQSEQGVPGGNQFAVRANTNLEQISDWVTKILVGIGLTQLGPIAEGAGALVRGVTPALGGETDSPVFGAALLVYFAIAGFFAGWLTTRLQLTAALSDLDRAMASLRAAEAAERAGDLEMAQDLRSDGIRLLSEAHQLHMIRQLMPAGPQRTAITEQMTAVAREQARVGQWTVEGICALFDQEADGPRVTSLALMQGLPSPDYLSRIMTALREPSSPSAQYHALLAAKSIAPSLGDDQRAQLRATVEELVRIGAIPPTSRRARLAADCLTTLLTA